MAKPLIIAEKPSAAKAIADALGNFKSRQGYLEGVDYTISWALGHLVTLADPDEYDPNWQRWSLGTLPMVPTEFRLKAVPKGRSQLKLLTRLAQGAPYLINACDAGREGELIFRYICSLAGLKQPVKRLWVSSLTREAIREAFSRLEPGEVYEPLYQSALCRSQGDWLVGMNATRAFTVRFGELYSVGRVQTPTLALVVARDREIAAFRPTPYYEVWAAFDTEKGAYRGRWVGEQGKSKLEKKGEAENLVAKVKGQQGQVSQVQSKQSRERPPQLFDLTTLQREANRRFGLTAAATLKAAQSLYEGKHITYPRTDSRYLTPDLLPQVYRTLQALSASYPQLVAAAELGRIKTARVINAKRVTDHHAILPTQVLPQGLKGAAAKIYELIARRFLAQFYPDAVYLETEVVTEVAGETFLTRGRRRLEAGWRVAEGGGGKAAEQAEPLPPLVPGLPAQVTQATVEAKETEPPKPYTEATLLRAMETAGKELDDEALAEAMKGRGLGTPATRAAIIERLKSVGYLEVAKKTLRATSKGHQLIQLAEGVGVKALLSAELTGDWEKRIADVQAGADAAAFMRDIEAYVRELVAQVKGATGLEVAATALAALGDCPRCKGPVEQSGRRYVCQRNCGFSLPGYLCGRVLAPSEVTTLLNKGKTELIKNFKSKAGKSFSARLVLEAEGKLGFEFPPSSGRWSTAFKGKRGRSRRKPESEASRVRKAGRD